MIKSEKTTPKLFFESSKRDIKISTERLELLHDIASKITFELNNRDTINLNFICTHNSRTSQMSQAWAFYASVYFKINNIYVFSGGTETTAFHRNTIKALQKTGFEFNIIDFSHQNPKYLISFKETDKNILGFSKKFDDEENLYPYIAITTCNHVDEFFSSTPNILNHFHLSFKDPKYSDSTLLEKEKHLETSSQIAGEIFIIFERIATLLNKI